MKLKSRLILMDLIIDAFFRAISIINKKILFYQWMIYRVMRSQMENIREVFSLAQMGMIPFKA